MESLSVSARAEALRLREAKAVRGDKRVSKQIRNSGKEFNMLYYALVFLVVGLIAGALNVAGVAAIAIQISWVLFLIGIVLLVIHLVTGRTVRVS